MSEAFVYLWYDSENKMFYLGKHKGTPEDRYTHSSTIWESFTKDNIPKGTKRRILAFGTNKEMCELEHKLLKDRKSRCWDRYYNESLGDPRYVDTSGKNNSRYKHGLTIGENFPKYMKQYRKDNKEKLAEYRKQYWKNNKEKIAEQRRQYRNNNKEYLQRWRKDNKEKIAELNKQYYENNKEKIAEQRRQYHKDNREKILEQKKQYYENNKEKIAERSKQYHKDNKEKILEQKKQYYEDNKEKIVERMKQYYEKQRYQETC
tara:strand:+ start:164 stop:946 length:783 start_codon:yes stop_codon:yes gene_type:complete